ncbi:MAG: HEAT repeat domain-containing protein [Phycisphaerae bacterium]|nr:HEAT repeat domain-containing protein [Phycisphaerae bacterium]
MPAARVFHSLCLALLTICLSVAPVSAADPTITLTAGRETEFVLFQRMLSSPAYRLDDRKTAAVLLLEGDWPEGINEVLTVLENDEDAQGQLAVAEALVETLPELGPRRDRFLEPLIAALSAEDEKLRLAAARAVANLANYNVEVLPRLSRIILQPDPATGEATRLAAVAAVEHIKEKKSAQILIKALDDNYPQLSARCRQGLEQLTGIPRGDDNDAWRLWWEQNKDRNLADWRLFYLTALMDQNRDLEKAIKQLREALQSQIEVRWETAQDKTQLLEEFLDNPLEDVRLQALLLAKTDLAPADFPEELQGNIRKLLTDPAAPVRAQAAELLRDLRDEQSAKQSAEIILEQLPQEKDPKVRVSFAEALGYIGGAEAVQPLIDLLADPDPLVVGKAALALGNLASDENLGLPKAPIEEALLDRYEKTTSATAVDAELRSQILSAMAQVGSSSFRPLFLQALKDTSVDSCIAAIEGLRSLGPNNRRKETLAAIRPLLADKDRAVRAEALRAFDDLADVGELETLEKRLDPNVEPDADMRDDVWHVVGNLLTKADLDTLNYWEQKIYASGNDERHRQILERVETKLAEDRTDPVRLIIVREKLGDYFETLKSWEAAAGKYRLAYDQAKTIPAPSILDTRDRLALKLLKALLNQPAFDQAAEHLEAIAAAPSPLEEEALKLTLDYLQSLLDPPVASKAAVELILVLENAHLPGLSQPPLSDTLSDLKAKALNLRRNSNNELSAP